jgi:hypothetical protein
MRPRLVGHAALLELAAHGAHDRPLADLEHGHQPQQVLLWQVSDVHRFPFPIGTTWPPRACA